MMRAAAKISRNGSALSLALPSPKQKRPCRVCRHPAESSGSREISTRHAFRILQPRALKR
jgi:hypothetical protein